VSLDMRSALLTLSRVVSVLLALGIFSCPAVATTPAAQPKSCNVPGTPTCPAPPPLPGTWTYSVNPGYDRTIPSGELHSFGDIDYYYNQLFVPSSWCSTMDISQVEGSYGYPRYQYGILNQDAYTFTYRIVEPSTPGGNPPQTCNYSSNTTAFVVINRTVSCPGTTAAPTYQSSPVIGPYCPPLSSANPAKIPGCPSCSPSGGNNSGGADSNAGTSVESDPVDASNGNAYYSETDYVGAGSSSLRFTRSANAIVSPDQYWNGVNILPGQRGYLGTGWVASFFQSLVPISVTDSTGVARSAVYAFRPDGRVLVFNLYNGVYSPDGDVADSLLQTGTGWEYQTANDTIESYNSAGQLISVAARGEAPVTVSYTNIGDPPSSVSDAFGHTLTFTYALDATGVSRLTGMTDPGGATTFTYSAGNLTSVTHQDGTSRQYTYGSGAFASSLTQVTDESGNAYQSWTYLTSDPGQRVGSSSFAGGVGTYSFSYATSGSGGSVSVTDPLGTSRTLTQQLVWGRYRMTGSNKYCSGCDSARTYDASGNITSRTDFNGVQTRYSYDVTHNLETSRTEGYGTAVARTVTTSWDTNWRQPDLITEPNRTRAYTYDAMGNVLTQTITDTTVTPNVARTWTYTYDSYGHRLTAKGPRTDVNSTTTYTYYSCTTGSQCGEVDTVTDPVGNVTTYNTYNANGQPLTITDPNGVVTTLTYDARYRLTSRQVGTETTAFNYYPTGLLKQVTLPDSSYLLYTYDNAHRLTQISDGAGNSTKYTLDAMGNRTAIKTYDPSSTLHILHTRVYNALNELYQDVNAAGTSAVTTTYAYDGNANQTAISAPLSRNTANTYDALNRLSQVTDPGSGVTHFNYDSEDDLTSVTDPRSLSTQYTYNGFGDVSQQISPDTGTTSNTYDSGGNVSVSTDARGAGAQYSYDAANRVTSIVYVNSLNQPDQTLTFGYDSGTNGKGHLTSAGDGNETLSWSYDGLGRVIGKGLTVGTSVESVGYAYTQGDLTGLVTPSGQAIAYTYNSNHQVTGITVNGITLVHNVGYEPFAGVNGWTWGDGSSVTRSFNGDGLVSQIVTAGVTLGYSYDNANRISGITDSSSSALSWTYGYDLLDRLGSATTSAITDGWTYDANGNRLTQTGTTPTTFSVNATSNELGSTTGSLSRTYSYDASGHTLSYGGASFTYNNRGRMMGTSASSTGYLYNALGQLVEKSGALGTTVVMYDEAAHLIGEYSSGGALIEETVWLGDIPVATLQANGSGGINIFYIHTDHLNSPRKISQPTSGTLAWRWDADPFGTASPNQNPAGLGVFSYNLRFPGQYFMAETGLNYNYMRDYDPATGRYIESDPIGLDGGINTYSYVGASPEMGTDPLGLLDPGGFVFPKTTPRVLPYSPTLPSAIGICARALGAIAFALTPSSISPCEDLYPPSNASCPDDEDRCKQALEQARRIYNELTRRSIPQYMYASRNGSANIGHHTAITQGQAALRTALDRVRRYCRVLPPDLEDMDNLANQTFPIRH